MASKLYDRISPPKNLRYGCMDREFYVPNTPEGHKVANLLHDELATSERYALFKFASDKEEDDLAEAYRKLQEDKGSCEKEDDDEADTKELPYDADDDNGDEGDDISFMTSDEK